MSTETSNSFSLQSAWQNMTQFAGYAPVEKQYLELINEPPENRGNRLCVCVSDLHLTDGTVGFQNLRKFAWDNFYSSLLQRCKNYSINELLFVLDGDIVDMIRSGKWAKYKIYPWERERKQEFSKVVNEIIREIVGKQHKDFFAMLAGLPERLKQDAGVETVKIVITIGNHDKELFCDNKALSYFYDKGLGIKIKDIPLAERRAIGRMYGDESKFEKLTTAPYLPFYYGDTGFRFFTTHGQWRDKENSCLVKKKSDQTAWSVKDGWSIKKWQDLGFSPFFEPCFGDSVAAGVLSSFIYNVKKDLSDAGYKDPRLTSILDELDLYRPTYAALTRILNEADSMRTANTKAQIKLSAVSGQEQVDATKVIEQKAQAIKIIEETLYNCIIEWLSWDFTYQTSPFLRCIGLKAAKKILEVVKNSGNGLEITAIAWLMKILAFFSRHHRKGLSLKEMRKFPAFLPEYRHYGFQIHGEGHTHIPLQEEPNIDCDHPSTYINFGTWRDQIIPRKKNGYRRRGVLRALYIMDLKNTSGTVKEPARAFDYLVEDIVLWGDFKDAMNESGKAESKT